MSVGSPAQSSWPMTAEERKTVMRGAHAAMNAPIPGRGLLARLIFAWKNLRRVSAMKAASFALASAKARLGISDETWIDADLATDRWVLGKEQL